MHAVADAEDRDAARPQCRIGVRRARIVDAVRSTGKDHGLGIAGGDLTPRGVERHEFRVHVELADASGDQLAVLAAEVQDDDRIRVRALNRIWNTGAHCRLRVAQLPTSAAYRKSTGAAGVGAPAEGRSRLATLRGKPLLSPGLETAVEFLYLESEGLEAIGGLGGSVAAGVPAVDDIQRVAVHVRRSRLVDLREGRLIAVGRCSRT